MTLTITTTAPFPTLLTQLTQQYASMVPATKYSDAFGTAPVGTGAFMFESMEPSRQLVLVKNPNWWGKADETPLPYLDRLVWKVMPDRETATLALQAGEIDLLYELPAALAPVLANDPSVTVSIAPTLGWEFVMFNVTQPPFDNVHARRAVQYAIDRSALVAAASFGTAFPALGPIAPGSWAYDEAATGAGSISATADLEAARAELAAGGLEGGFSFPLIYPTSPEFSTMAQALQPQLAEIGITVELVGKDLGATLDDLFSSNFTALMINWSGRIDEALTFPSFFKTGGGNNFGKFSDPEIDAIIDAASVAPSLEERKALYQQAQAMVIEASPLAWLTVPSELRATRADVSGFTNYGDLRVRAWTISKE